MVLVPIVLVSVFEKPYTIVDSRFRLSRRRSRQRNRNLQLLIRSQGQRARVKRENSLFMSSFIVDLRINETLQTSAIRKPPLPFSRLVGTVSNCADAVRLGNRPYRGVKVSIYF